MSFDTKKYINLIHKIREYESALEHQDLWWTVVAMVGKVNDQGLEPQLLDAIQTTQLQFAELRSQLVQNLISRYLDRVEIDLKLKSQSFIDILNRNLFERTADVGFLATDNDIIKFLEDGIFTACLTEQIVARLQEYVKKYTVYSDVVILTPDLKVVARLDTSIDKMSSEASILKDALNSADYIEYDSPIDVVSFEQSPLYFIQRIEHKNQVIGLLCLSFKFEDELKRIHKTLSGLNDNLNLSLINDGGKVIYNSHGEERSELLKQSQGKLLDIKLGQIENFAYVTKTTGYQGYQGLPWLGTIQSPLADSFNPKVKSSQEEMLQLNPASSLFPHDLNELNLKINTALLIVILNGKISSIKNNVKAFLPVLDSFQDIGSQIRSVFAESIKHIHQITYETTREKVLSASTVSLDVMDRNLYERANDCRWWALNKTIRDCLSVKADSQRALLPEVQSILEYINSLYTVYTLLFIYDKKGQVIALSNNDMPHLLGTNIANLPEVQNCLKLTNAQAYSVSDFTQSDFYKGASTYIYHAAVFNADNSREVVGGIGVVFDATPEFKAILEDFLPKESDGSVMEGAFAFFVNEQDIVISATDNTLGLQAGIPLSKTLLDPQLLNNQPEGGYDIEVDGVSYLVGETISKGYREYKNTDGYHNPIRCMVCVKG